jgi:hypothetical protein
MEPSKPIGRISAGGAAAPAGGQSAGPSAAQTQAVNTVLARLTNLASAAMEASTLSKAANLIVNQIHTLARTERAVLVPITGRRRIYCISGDLEPSQDNAFSQAVHEVRRGFGDNPEPRVLARDDLPEELDVTKLPEVLDAMNGTRVLWLPLPSVGGGAPRYALWLERWKDRDWNPEEIRLLSRASIFFGHALTIPRKKKRAEGAGKRVAALLVIALIALMFIPVHARINAPVQVVPDHPYYVFAPFDGIVDELIVSPGETVDEGEVIFRYDTRVMEKRLDEARQAVAVAQAELARLEGAAYDDQEARAKIPVQKLEVQRKQSDVSFIESQLALSEVRTEKAGIVVLDDPDALIGAALKTGEMVLSIAEPTNTKLQMMVPVTDAGLVSVGAETLVRLDSAPLKSIPAKVERLGFDVRVSDEQIPSVLAEGVWAEETAVMPGQRGVARITGPETALGLQFFRKPLMKVRVWLGI